MGSWWKLSAAVGRCSSVVNLIIATNLYTVNTILPTGQKIFRSVNQRRAFSALDSRHGRIVLVGRPQAYTWVISHQTCMLEQGSNWLHQGFMHCHGMRAGQAVTRQRSHYRFYTAKVAPNIQKPPLDIVSSATLVDIVSTSSLNQTVAYASRLSFRKDLKLSQISCYTKCKTKKKKKNCQKC